MLISIHHQGRVYKVEARDACRIYRNAPDLEDCIVLRDPENPEATEKSRYLLTPFAITAARRCDYGFRLISETEAEAV